MQCPAPAQLQVLAGAFDQRKAGRSGVSSFLTELTYLDAANFWLVPVAHTLLLGLVKGFWNRVLAQVSTCQAHAKLASLI